MKTLIWVVLLILVETNAKEKQNQEIVNSTLVESKSKMETSKIQRTSEVLKTKRQNENDKVQERGFLDPNYPYGDNGYYAGQEVPDLPIREPTLLPPVYPNLQPESVILQNLPGHLLHGPGIQTENKPGPPINLGHSTTIEKTITLYQGIPMPYPVIKHVAVPVEKHIHIPIKLPIPAPYPVAHTVHVPVKVPVKVPIPVPVPQPYPVNKYIPVKVFVDKPYSVYAPNQWGSPNLPNLPIPINPCRDHKLVQLPAPLVGPSGTSVLWKPEEDYWEPQEPTIDEEEYDEAILYDRPGGAPQFVTLEKPLPDFYSASNNVNNYTKKRPLRRPGNGKYQEKRPQRPNIPQRQQKPIRPQYSNQEQNRDDHDHRYRYRDLRNNSNKYHNNHRDLQDYEEQNRNRQEHREQNSNAKKLDRQDKSSDEFVLHTNF